jgi:hypothetical protein
VEGAAAAARGLVWTSATSLNNRAVAFSPKSGGQTAACDKRLFEFGKVATRAHKDPAKIHSLLLGVGIFQASPRFIG